MFASKGLSTAPVRPLLMMNLGHRQGIAIDIIPQRNACWRAFSQEIPGLVVLVEGGAMVGLFRGALAQGIVGVVGYRPALVFDFGQTPGAVIGELPAVLIGD